MSNLAVITSRGQVGFTVARAAGYATGIIKLTFNSPHPSGNADYLISCTNEETGHIKVWSAQPQQVSKFHVVVFDTGNSLANSTIHFFVLA